MRHLPFLLTFCLFMVGSASAQKDATLESAQQIAERLQVEHDLIGLAVSIYVSGETPDKGAAGVRVKGSSASATVNDKWHIGSCTKAMTAALIGAHVQAGAIDWDTKLPDAFPTLADEMDPAWSDVTLAQLLNHTSGIRDKGATWFLARANDTRPMIQQREETVSDLLSDPPGGETGSFLYSNFGYIVAGAALESLTGKSWEELMRESFLADTLGTETWGVGPPQGDQPEGHRRKLLFGGVSPVGQTWKRADNPMALGPAGTLHATHDAWARFAFSMIDNDSPLTAETRARILTPARGQDYALGWAVIKDDRLGTLYQHAGSNTFWLSQIVIIPDRQAVILVSTNQQAGEADAAVRAATRAALRRFTLDASDETSSIR